jgi:hypothetical protein
VLPEEMIERALREVVSLVVQSIVVRATGFG